MGLRKMVGIHLGVIFSEAAEKCFPVVADFDRAQVGVLNVTYMGNLIPITWITDEVG